MLKVVIMKAHIINTFLIYRLLKNCNMYSAHWIFGLLMISMFLAVASIRPRFSSNSRHFYLLFLLVFILRNKLWGITFKNQEPHLKIGVFVILRAPIEIKPYIIMID